jgi:hypothetical protein
MPKKPDPTPRQFNVGDEIRVNMHAGKIVDATIKAVISQTDGLRLQVDFGFNQTALIHEWQVVKEQGGCGLQRREALYLNRNMQVWNASPCQSCLVSSTTACVITWHDSCLIVSNNCSSLVTDSRSISISTVPSG